MYLTSSPPPLRVFVSSTDVDLHDHRTAALDIILRWEQLPLDMRFFGAQATGTATTISVDGVDRADVVILLIAWRYGTVDPHSGLSITQQEYQEALKLGLPIFVYLADPATENVHGKYGALFPVELRNHENEARVLAFRDEVKQGRRVVEQFTTPDDLAKKIATDLGKYVLQQRDAWLRQQQKLPSIPRNLPLPVPDFVGREHELIQIDADLRRGQHTAVAAAVAGMGGVGKSALAAQVVCEIARDAEAFRGGITWVSCNDLVGWKGMSAIYAQLLLDWGITLSPESEAAAHTPQQEAEVRAQALRGRLALSVPSLVLLDNVERDLPLKEVLTTLAHLGMTVIVTTRTFFNLPQLTVRRLDVLAPEEAHTLLKERYVAKGGTWVDKRDTVPSLAAVEALGYLPLAIELAASRAARLGLSLVRLDRELHEPDATAKLNDPNDPTAGVRYVLGRTLDLLAPLERACFDALGMHAAVSYPQKVLHALFWVLLDGTDAEKPARTLDLLVTLSLVVLEEADGILRARLHPLLHDIAASEWRALDSRLLQRGRDTMLVGLNAFARTHKHDFLLLARDEALYVEALRDAARHSEDRRALITLSWTISDYLDMQGRWALYGKVLQLQLHAYRELGDRTGEGAALGNLGVLAANQGRYEEAAQYYAQSLSILRELGDRSGEGAALGNLGVLAMRQGRYEEAEQYCAQHLAITREQGDRAREGVALGNLGILAADQGRYTEAEQYYAQSLSILRELGDRSGEGHTLDNLGQLAMNQGQYTEAEQYYQQSLALLESIGDVDAAIAQRNLEELHRKMHETPSPQELAADLVSPPPRQGFRWPWQRQE